MTGIQRFLALLPIASAAIVPYFNYEGNLRVGGKVEELSTELTTQTLKVDFHGLDPNCANGATSGVANSCGIHIHEGTDCTSDAGGHFFDREKLGDSDPWANIGYMSSGDDNSFVGHFDVDTGYDAETIKGHAIIIHDVSGGRIACTIYNHGVDLEDIKDDLIDKADKLEDKVDDKVDEIKDKVDEKKDALEELLIVQAAKKFVPYFNYDGDLKVTGEVSKVYSNGTTQTLEVAFEGLDPHCDDGPRFFTDNSCGIHIHQGTDCTSDAGGHYFNVDLVKDDPWEDVGYESGESNAFKGTLVVDTGFEAKSITGHVVIVHDASGSRISCGVLEKIDLKDSASDLFGDLVDDLKDKKDDLLDKAEDKKDDLLDKAEDKKDDLLDKAEDKIDEKLGEIQAAKVFVPYFNYKGDLSVDGAVKSVSTKNTTQKIVVEFSGLDPKCKNGPSSAANSCGIHIHQGTDCTSDAGGHYYNKQVLKSDPWVSVTYTSSGEGDDSFKGIVNVDTGFTAADITGHAFIVHDADGTRIACGILEEGKPLETAFGDDSGATVLKPAGLMLSLLMVVFY